MENVDAVKIATKYTAVKEKKTDRNFNTAVWYWLFFDLHVINLSPLEGQLWKKNINENIQNLKLHV